MLRFSRSARIADGGPAPFVARSSSGPRKAYVPSPVKFDAVSESRDKFRAHDVQPLPNIPVKPYRNTGAKFDDVTTNRAMYAVDPSAYQRLAAPKKAYVPSPVKFDTVSESRAKYTAHATEIRTPPIGLWVANDLVEVMVQPGADRPLSVSKMFSTTSNGQDEMELKIVEGWSRKASECKLLTVFEIEGNPSAARGSPADSRHAVGGCGGFDDGESRRLRQRQRGARGGDRRGDAGVFGVAAQGRARRGIAFA